MKHSISQTTFFQYVLFEDLSRHVGEIFIVDSKPAKRLKLSQQEKKSCKTWGLMIRHWRNHDEKDSALECAESV